MRKTLSRALQLVLCYDGVMKLLAFILNLPWTCVGIILLLISVPKHIQLHMKPFALVATVGSFWWQTWQSSHKGTRAVSIGNIVLLGENLLPYDKEHELVHVMQYERAPFIQAFLYIYQSLKYGYKNNKYEIEAYKLAGNRYVEK